MKLHKTLFTFLSLLLLFGLVAIPAFGQSDSLAGKYVGKAKVAGSPDAEITLELVNTNGKITGHLMNGPTKIEVTEGSLAEGKLTLKLGPAAKDGTVTAKLDPLAITGEWLVGSQKKTIELKRVGESAPAADAPINLNGQWDAIADANGQPFPFLLTLKVDGEKVTGGSSSQLGESNISTGSWKDGRLSIQLEGQNGVVTMSATVIEGKLSGEFDYAGQLQGKWVAVKKN